MDKYEIVETIGTGSFSVVNKAIEKETNKFVALKCIDKVGPLEIPLEGLHKLIKICILRGFTL